MKPASTYQIAEAVLSALSPVKKKRKRAPKVPNGPLGSPGDALVKKSGLPFGLGNAGPGGGR